MRGYKQPHHGLLKTTGLRLLTVFLLLAVIAMLQGAWSIYNKERAALERRTAAEAERDELSAREHELKREIAYLNDPRGIETELRSQFDLALPGERMIVIVDRPDTENIVVPVLPWWKRIFSSW